MEVPAILGIPYLLFWGIVSVILQNIIMVRVKQCGESAYEEFIKGNIFTSSFNGLWIVTKFLYNPKNWKDIQNNHIKVLLTVNFIIVAYFIFSIFTV